MVRGGLTESSNGSDKNFRGNPNLNKCEILFNSVKDTLLYTSKDKTSDKEGKRFGDCRKFDRTPVIMSERRTVRLKSTTHTL